MVDTPPVIDADARRAMRGADLVVVPLQPSAPDLWAAEATLKLAKDEKRPVCLVLNRVHQVQAAGLSAARARAAAEERADDGDHLTAGLLALHADLAGAADRQRRLARRFSVGHPNTPVAEVPALAEDVHDVDGLRQVGEALAAG